MSVTAPILGSIVAVHVDATQRQAVRPTAPRLRIPRATDAVIALFVRDSDNARTDITDAGIILTVRRALADALPVIAVIANVTDGPEGEAQIALAQSHTADLDVGDYFYSVEVTWPNGEREQLVAKTIFSVIPTVGAAGDPLTSTTPESVILYNLPDPTGHVGDRLTVADDDPASLAWVTPSSGDGTVTSVAMTVPNFLTIAGTPITGAGTLALALALQAANRVFAGPASGGNATPTFRALVAADIPALPAYDASGAAAAAQAAAILLSLQRASNLSDLASPSTARTNLGLGTAAVAATGDFDAAGAAAAAQSAAATDATTKANAASAAAIAASNQRASNLSDVANAATARTNLGLGTAATHAHGDYDAAGAAAAAQAASQPVTAFLTTVQAATAANLALIGPASGAAAPMTARALVAADISGGFAVDRISQRISDAVARAEAAAPALSNASWTEGVWFSLTKPGSIIGAKVWWTSSGGALTLKIRLVDSTGTTLQTVNISVNATGLYTATFSAATAISGTNLNRRYAVSRWETSGAKFLSAGNAWFVSPIPVPPRATSDDPFTVTDGVIVSSFYAYAAGDNAPTTHGNGSFALVDPIVLF